MYSLKKIILFFVLIPFSVFSQINLYQSATSGSWDSLSTWKKWNGVNYYTPTPEEGVPNYLDSTISILSNHIVKVTSNISVDNLIVNAGATIVIDSAVVLTILDGGGADLDVFGKLINKGEIVETGNLIFENGSLYQHNFSSAGSTRGIIPVASWMSGSTCEIVACGNSFVPSGLNQVFYNFIWNNNTQPQNFNLVASPTIVNGNFEIKSTNSFQLRYKSNTSGDLTVRKNLIVEGGAFVLTNGGSSATVNVLENFYQSGGTFDLSTSSTASANGYLFVTKGFFHVGGSFRKSGSGGTLSEVRMNSSSSASTIESIGFNSSDNIIFNIKQALGAQCRILSNKAFILNNGTVFSVSDNGTTSADLTIDGTFLVNTHTWNFLSGISAVSNGGTFINNSLLLGTSTPTTLVFNSGSIFRHNVDGGSVASATWSKNSTLEIVGIVSAAYIDNTNQSFGKILWKCPMQNSSAELGITTGFSVQNTYQVSSTGSGILRFPDIDFVIGGDLIVESSSRLQISNGVGLYFPNVRKIMVDGNVNIKDDALLTVGATNLSSVLALGEDKYRNYVFLLKKNFIYSSSIPMVSYYQRSFPGAANDESYRLLLHFMGDTIQSIDYAPISSNLIEVSSDEYVSNNIYDVKVSGTTKLILNSSLKVQTMLVEQDATLDLSKGVNNLVHYSLLSIDGARAKPSSLINGTINLGDNIVTEDSGEGEFRLNPGASIVLSHSEGLDSSRATGGIQTKGAILLSENANYIYRAAHNQITGTGLPKIIRGTLTVDNITNLFSGGLFLSSNTSIVGHLNLTEGKLITSDTSLLTIENEGSVFPEGGRSNSFVDGPIKKIGFVAGNEFVFPTGDTAKWARIGFKSLLSSGTDAFTAEYFKSNPQIIDTTLNRSSLNQMLNKISSREYWDLNRVSGVATGKVILYWEDAVDSRITDASSGDLRIAHYYNSFAGLKWYAESDENSSAVSQTFGGAGSIESFSYFTSFSPITFGSADGQTALPIKLVSFTGLNVNNRTQLKWKTASEINNDYFEIERSSDGFTFYRIARINAKGNSTVTNDYYYEDNFPNKPVNYYRLKQIDYDGHFTYSNIISINSKDDPVYFELYPNPTTSKIIISSSDKIVSVLVYNASGEMLEKLAPYSNQFEYEPNVNGLYWLKIETELKFVTTKCFLKK